METRTLWRLWVNYGEPLDWMITAGHYTLQVGEFLPKLFPLEGRGLVEFYARYFVFDRRTSALSAIERIMHENRESPWSPAKIEHICSHGAAFPDEQRTCSIVGLGSMVTIGGRNYVPMLHGNASDRVLALGLCDDVWLPGTCFLAVRRNRTP